MKKAVSFAGKLLFYGFVLHDGAHGCIILGLDGKNKGASGPNARFCGAKGLSYLSLLPMTCKLITIKSKHQLFLLLLQGTSPRPVALTTTTQH